LPGFASVDDPLDFVDFVDVIGHGDPARWRFRGPKPGSPTRATSPDADPGTAKHYDLYEDEHGRPIELHYFRYADGSVGDVKVKS
jgi:hypothetical protein